MTRTIVALLAALAIGAWAVLRRRKPGPFIPWDVPWDEPGGGFDRG